MFLLWSEDMEKKKKIFTLSISVLVIFIIIVGVLIFMINNKTKEEMVSKTEPTVKEEDVNEEEIQPIIIKAYNNKEYYIIEDDYSGEYDLQYTDLTKYWRSDINVEELFQKQTIMNYTEYKSYCEQWNFKQKYTDPSRNYIVFSYAATDKDWIKARLANIEYSGDSVNLYIWDTAGKSVPGQFDISSYMIVIPINTTVDNVNIQPVYTKSEFKNIKKYGSPEVPVIHDEEYLEKPIIYLYPEEETEVMVELGYPEKLICSYPKCTNNKWNVKAKSNGDLIDISTQRDLYALYYESDAVVEFDIEDTGFIVKGEDTISFLEEKLELLGLTEREAEEFIIYWLPRLEANKYNYIRFATIEEINENMPLNIEPNPDTIIRVLMTYKGLEEPIAVEEQKIVTPERKGFVVVEWGGMEIKK